MPAVRAMAIASSNKSTTSLVTFAACSQQNATSASLTREAVEAFDRVLRSLVGLLGTPLRGRGELLGVLGLFAGELRVVH